MPLQLYDLPFDMLEMIGNTPGEGPVLCYQSCHNHPKRVFCRATRAEYFARILAKAR